MVTTKTTFGRLDGGADENMSPIMMKDGKFLILDYDYELDFEASIRNTMSYVLVNYGHQFNFNFANTRKMLDELTKKVIETIDFYTEKKKDE